MIHLIIGHRGVGKTSFLDRISAYYDEVSKPVSVFDLDKEISQRLDQPLESLFASEGESGFRRYEERVLNELMSENQKKSIAVYIAVGAGYSGAWPEDARKIWLRRESDAKGRVFLDRPRLNIKVSPLEEFRERYKIRNQSYSSLKHDTFILREGSHLRGGVDSVAEKVFLGLMDYQLGGYYTLMPEDVTTPKKVKSFYEKRKSWGIGGFEVRDDILTREEILSIQDVIPKENILFSRRVREDNLLWQGHQIDWALELGTPPEECDWVSLHKREKTLEETFQRISEHRGKKQKLAIPIANFEELIKCHKWFSEDAGNRSFLPISSCGRWSWYRLLHLKQMPLQFFRESQGSAPDQPSFSDLVSFIECGMKNKFSAILGDPVDLSWTPTEQGDFFAQLNMPVLRIKISEEELTKKNLDFLNVLGLSAAAVTAPLKQKVFSLAQDYPAEVSETVKQLSSANTILFQKEKLCLENTDIVGFKQSVNKAMSDFDIAADNIAIWGGGGTLSMMKSVLPEAVCYSARTGEVKSGSETLNPKMIVWGVGRSRMGSSLWPKQDWTPEVVFDLNYSEDSPGREYAQKCGARYISGEQFFLSQAEAQRLFWAEYFNPV